MQFAVRVLKMADALPRSVSGRTVANQVARSCCSVAANYRAALRGKSRRAPGQALSDFNIFRLVAHYWGCENLFSEWVSPEAAFQILKRLSADTPCDITGIRDFQMIDDWGGIQWPFPKSDECRVTSDESEGPGSIHG